MSTASVMHVNRAAASAAHRMDRAARARHHKKRRPYHRRSWERLAEVAEACDLIRLGVVYVVRDILVLLEASFVALVGLQVALIQAFTNGRICIPKDAALRTVVAIDLIPRQLGDGAILLRRFDRNLLESRSHQPRFGLHHLVRLALLVSFVGRARCDTNREENDNESDEPAVHQMLPRVAEL